MGTPHFAVQPLRYLVLNGYEIAAVYTRADRPAGRGRVVASSPVKTAAQEMGLAVRQPATMKGRDVLAELAGLKPDAIVVCAYGQILPRSVLDLPACGGINVHPSLLPRHRGAAPIPAAILAGDDFTGVSIMLMDEGMDTGPVLAQAQIAIASHDTAGSLGDKLSSLSAMLLLETLTAWSRREIRPRPQDGARATYSRPLTKEQGEIDWRWPALEISRRVRAFHPWPGCYTKWGGKQLKISAARPVPGSGPCTPGTVLALGGPAGAPGICTGDGVLGIGEVQLEGKRVVTGADFLRGQRNFVGAVLPD